MGRPRRGLAAALASSAIIAWSGWAAPASADSPQAYKSSKIPEPKRFFQGPLHSPTATTLMGATPKVADIDTIAKVISLANLHKVTVKEKPLLLDVSDRATATAPNYQSIPGAVLLVDAGNGTDDKAFDDAYKARIATLTKGDINTPLMVFSHPQDWSGYNAAKRLVYYGYKHIRWYRGGVDGWQKGGYPVAPVKPDEVWQTTMPKEASK